jgi:hypothetical protein
MAATNIQAAVDAAMPSGTVWVADGRYVSHDTIWLNSKPVSIRSVNGPSVTMLDGGYPAVSNPVFSVNFAGVEISGFTITGGGRGGLWFFSAGKVTDSIIEGNYALMRGGGVHTYVGGLVSNCIIRGNSVGATNYTSAKGGGAFLNWGGWIVDCLITTNIAPYYGGGVEMYRTGTVLRCEITGNRGDVAGSGIHTTQGGVVRENRILHNQTSLRGPGLCCDEGYAVVENNLIAGQHADSLPWIEGGSRA